MRLFAPRYLTSSISPLLRGLMGLAVLSASALAGAPARAGSFINRSLTLPQSTWELGLGAGLARVPNNIGLGFNFELGVGLSSAVELRVRTGLRLGADGRALHADTFGRPYDNRMHNTGGDTLANPEIGVTWALVGRGALELGLDARLTLPTGGNLGVLLGIPVRLHFSRVRLDTGLYVPIVFHDGEDDTEIHLPLHIFFDVSGGTYLGPITGVVFDDAGDRVPLGLAVGTSVAADADLRAWLLIPDVSHSGSAKHFGGGIALFVMF